MPKLFKYSRLNSPPRYINLNTYNISNFTKKVDKFYTKKKESRLRNDFLIVTKHSFYVLLHGTKELSYPQMLISHCTNKVHK